MSQAILLVWWYVYAIVTYPGDINSLVDLCFSNLKKVQKYKNVQLKASLSFFILHIPIKAFILTSFKIFTGWNQFCVWLQKAFCLVKWNFQDKPLKLTVKTFRSQFQRNKILYIVLNKCYYIYNILYLRTITNKSGYENNIEIFEISVSKSQPFYNTLFVCFMGFHSITPWALPAF